MATQKNKTAYKAAFALFLLGIGYLLFSGFTEGSMYFRDVSEALAAPREEMRATRLFGTVKADGISMYQAEPGVRFLLEDQHDKTKFLWVDFKGAVPDAFKPGAEVIIEGGFVPDKDDFQARTLMTKCPSKYQKENRG